MATATTDMRAPTSRRAGDVNRWLVAAVLVLAAALVGFGAWVIVDRVAAEQSDFSALLDENMAAINEGDAAAAAANYTEDATLDMFGDVHTGRRAIEGRLQDAIGVGTHVERVGDVTVNGEYAVAFAEWTNDLGMSGSDLGVFQLEDGLIKGHWEFLLDEWPPSGLGE